MCRLEGKEEAKREMFCLDAFEKSSNDCLNNGLNAMKRRKLQEYRAFCSLLRQRLY